MRKAKLKNEKQSPFAIPEALIADRDLFELKQKQYAENISPLGAKTEIGFVKQIIKPRYFKWFFCFFAAVFFIFLGRSAALQIFLKPKLIAAAERNRIRILRIAPERGLITDRNGIVLASNQPQFVVTLTPADLPSAPEKQKEVIEKVSRLINVDVKEIEEKVSSRPQNFSPYEPILICDNIGYEKAILFQIKGGAIPGLNIELTTRRTYLNEKIFNQSFSHLIGYVGYLTEEEFKKNKDNYGFDDQIGKAGAELSFEKLLKGQNGKRWVEVDALGKTVSILAEEAAMPGENIILTVDSEFQHKVFEILNKHLEKSKLKKAAAVVLNPQNGEILALVSLPSYDNEKFVRGFSQDEYQILISDSNKPFFNRAIAGEYPSGSTIKPVIAAAALDAGLIKENTSFLSIGGIKVGQWFFPDWKAGGHGWTAVRQALAESINTFFYIIGGGYQDFPGLGLEKIVEYAKLFGFGQKTSLVLPSEKPGFLPTAEWKLEQTGQEWYIGDTYHLSIGQGYLLVTPLQIAQATAVFANQGILFKPKIVYGIKNPADEIVEYEQSEIIRKDFLKPSAISIVRNGLRDTVTYGSARQLNSLPIAAAGKTGSAQWHSERPTHAWFTVFAPFVKPEIVVTILIEEGGEGSSAAVPVAKEIIDWRVRNRFKSVNN